MKTLIIIPSRLAATRLPGKPLLKINGISIISHVFKRAESANIGEVIVATEDQEIIDDVKKGTRDAGDSASNDRRAKTTTQNKTRSGLKKGKVPEKILKTIGNKVVNISVLPKLRE